MDLKLFIWQSSAEGRKKIMIWMNAIYHHCSWFNGFFWEAIHRTFYSITRFFFISNNFLTNTKPKLAKNQAKPKQHVIIQNYMRYSKKCVKSKRVCFNEIMWLIIMKMRLKIKIGSHRYDINRIWPDMDTNVLNIKCVSVWWWLCAISNT